MARHANSGSIKKGEVRNPKGRPKDNESWSGVLRLMSNATAEEIAEMVGGKSTDLGRAFLQMPKGVQIKYLMSLRAIAGFMFEPNNSLWQTIIERVEGKVQQPVDITSDNKEINFTLHIASDNEPRDND